MTPTIGNVYWRKGDRFKAVVVEVTGVDDAWVTYRVLHGPRSLLRKPFIRCKLANFADWQECERRESYDHLDGCKPAPTFLVLGVGGDPLFRCSERRANYYRRKGVVRDAGDGVLQFTDDATEKRLRELHPGEFSEFFFAVKNDRCCVCGSTAALTRHHVVPTRHKPNLPRPWRSCLSNVLFVCWDCHKRYEDTPEPEVLVSLGWPHYAHAWRDHFLRVMQPRFLPEGWDIVCIDDLESVRKNGDGA
jgi:5-methylcytosine-specific restriction endonuclease McrA